MREDDILESKTVSERIESLVRVDCIRLSRLLETAQYAMLYAVLCIPIGIGIDRLFSRAYPRIEEGGTYSRKQCVHAVLVVALQVAFNAICIFYMRKLVNIVPVFLKLCKAYVSHYHIEEFFGEVAIAVVFVGIQTNLISVLDKLRHSF